MQMKNQDTQLGIYPLRDGLTLNLHFVLNQGRSSVVILESLIGGMVKKKSEDGAHPSGCSPMLSIDNGGK